MLVKVDSVRDRSSIEKSTLVYIDSLENTSIQNLPFSKFTSLEDFGFRKKVPRRLVTKMAYLEFSLQNKTGSAANFYFFPGMPYRKIILYEKDSQGKLNKVEYAGSNSGFAYLSVRPYHIASYVVALKFSKQI